MSPEAFEPRVHVRSSESDGAVGIIEMSVPAGWDGPRLHRHDFDEAFYVLEGELTFQLGDEIVTGGPASMTFAPRGSHHAVANLSDAPARYLLVCTPGGFERRFLRRAAERAGVEPPPEALEPYPEVVFVGPTIREHLAGG